MALPQIMSLSMLDLILLSPPSQSHDSDFSPCNRNPLPIICIIRDCDIVGLARIMESMFGMSVPSVKTPTLHKTGNFPA